MFCYVCESSKLSLLGNTTIVNLATLANSNLNRSIWKCKNCDSLSIYPVPSDSELEQYYNNYSNQFLNDTVDKWQKRKSLKSLLNLCQQLKYGKILDIGCADGQLLEMLPSSFQKFGLDTSEIACNLARKKGISVICSTFETAHFSEKFDLIIALDFLEHLARPKDILRKISNLLNPGGFVVIETGNATSLISRILRENWSYLSVFGHLCVFSSKALINCANLLNIETVTLQKGHHSVVPLKQYIYFNVCAFGFHFFRRCCAPIKSIIEKNELLKHLYYHSPPGSIHKDHMIFIGQKQNCKKI